MPLLTLPVFLILTFAAAPPADRPTDTTAAHRVFTSASQNRLNTRPIGSIISEIGRSLIGSPYEAGTLDTRDTEVCVANLKTFDCVTFIENVLALSRCVKAGRTSYADYLSELTRIRYRGGICSGYVSRLHYFSSWIEDNSAKHIVADVTGEAGGIPVLKTIRFMTSHRNRYPRLADETSYREIGRIEDSLSGHPRRILPAAAVARRDTSIREGDIIAVATSIEGLDVSHTGFAVRDGNGKIHLLHAPDVGKTVTIMSETLAEYLSKNRSRNGIIILRPLEP
jgi:hypothetical protein